MPLELSKKTAKDTSKNALIKRLSTAILTTGIMVASQNGFATTVQFQTVLGDFEVNLYDETTPKTVANFLAYVEDEAYTQTFIHRSIPGFVIQGGGYVYDEEKDEPVWITTKAAVENEPVWSNRRGTIAMAKVGSNPNSATSQWFISLDDNHENLDVQNGGFTAFGEVVGDGMEVVDAIAKLPRFAFRGDFSNLPLRNFGEDEVEEEVIPGMEHFVLFSRIQVLDPSEDTAADLNPVPNTLIDEYEEEDKGSSSSGSFGWASVLMLLGLAAARRATARRSHTAMES